MPKLIEIIGPPGSGKSFISSKLTSLSRNTKKKIFHSNKYSDYEIYKNVNFFIKIFIAIKVSFIIIFFYILFWKRIFLKKIYRRKFFISVIMLFYKHLFGIEILKKVLSSKNYLITEPGPIMYFIQDYFYISNNIEKNDIKIFNKFFLNTDYIIKLECNLKLLIKRINLRSRGLPTRMRNLNKNQIKIVLNKAISEINNYFSKNKNHKVNVIVIDSSKNQKKNLSYILEKIR